MESFQLFPAAVAVQHTGSIQTTVGSTPHIIVAVAHHQHPLALQGGLAEHITHDLGFGVPAFVHRGAADKIKILCQPLLFQNGGDHLGGLGGGSAQEKTRVFQGLQHLQNAREHGTLVTALHRITRAVKVGSFFDQRRVGEVLAEAFAQGRAQIAAQVDAGYIHTHGAENLLQCMNDTGGRIDQRPVHIK